MTDEQRELLGRIYGHQLQGIMFHFDMMCILKLFDDRPMLVSVQHKQAVCETKAHMETVLMVIDNHQELIHPKDTDRYPLAVILDDKPASKMQRDIFTKKLIEQWIEYEHMTADIYDEAIEMFPDCSCWWKKLKKESETEAKTAQRLLSRVS